MCRHMHSLTLAQPHTHTPRTKFAPARPFCSLHPSENHDDRASKLELPSEGQTRKVEKRNEEQHRQHYLPCPQEPPTTTLKQHWNGREKSRGSAVLRTCSKPDGDEARRGCSRVHWIVQFQHVTSLDEIRLRRASRVGCDSGLGRPVRSPEPRSSHGPYRKRKLPPLKPLSAVRD